MIKVTVVIPVYNAEAYLPACIDSVLGQSLREIEIICIDDASPDGSSVILDEYASKDVRVKTIHLSENHGQGHGRNIGIDTARGKYIYFLDCDDMITETALEELYEIAESDRLDGVIFDSQVLFESAELKRKNQARYQTMREGIYPCDVINGQDLLDLFCMQNEWNVYVQRQFWRAGYLRENEIRNLEGMAHEDEVFSFKAMLLAKRMRYVRRDWFIRRYREGSVMTRDPHPEDFHGYFTAFREMIRFAELHHISGYGSKSNIYRMYENMIRFYPNFCSQAEPAEWFTPDELLAYQCFSYEIEISDYYHEKIKSIVKEIPVGARIWIYGAGVIGQRAYRALISEGYDVGGFIVSDTANSKKKVLNKPVKKETEIEAREDMFIIVAVGGEYIDEVCGLLDSKGRRYAVYPIGR